MADEADIAQARMEHEENIRRARTCTFEIAESDTCMNCGEPTTGGRRWCDMDCRIDWEKREERV